MTAGGVAEPDLAVVGPARDDPVGDPFGTASIRAATLAAWTTSPTRFREDANLEEDHGRGYYRDRVVVEPILACGQCDACLHGKYNVCDSLGFHGLSGGGGGFADFTAVGERWVHKMPEGLSFEQGALVKPAAVALHAVRMRRNRSGSASAWSRRRSPIP